MIDSIILATIFSYFITEAWKYIEAKLYGKAIEREVETIVICIVWVCLFIVSIISKEL